MNQPERFKATELFEIIVNKDAKYPFNLDFELLPNIPKDVFKNKGIFSLYYRGELIYIGFSNSNEDIRTTRFVRQLQTITMRGALVQFNQSTIDLIPKLNQISKVLVDQNLIPQTKDYVTSVNRLYFSEHHWDEFSQLENGFLKFFEFDWYVITDNQNIENSAKSLKSKYKPRCNKEFDLLIGLSNLLLINLNK